MDKWADNQRLVKKAPNCQCPLPPQHRDLPLVWGCWWSCFLCKAFCKAFNEFPVQKSYANITASQLCRPALHPWRTTSPAHHPLWSSKVGHRKQISQIPLSSGSPQPPAACSQANFPWGLHRERTERTILLEMLSLIPHVAKTCTSSNSFFRCRSSRFVPSVELQMQSPAQSLSCYDLPSQLKVCPYRGRTKQMLSM